MKQSVIRLLASISIILLCFSCGQTTKVEIEYYKNGNKKTEYSVDKEGVLQGRSMAYYEDGSLKYSGVYIDGLRSGDHKEYYANGTIKRIFTYIIENGREKWISKKIFDENGMIVFDGRYTTKQFSFTRLNDVVTSGDTLKLLVRLKDPTYYNSVIYLGNYDHYLKILDNPDSLLEFNGKKNEVIVSVPVKPGRNVVKGLFRDFTMQLYPENDTLAYTVAEESYFEYEFEGIRKTEL